MSFFDTVDTEARYFRNLCAITIYNICNGFPVVYNCIFGLSELLDKGIKSFNIT